METTKLVIGIDIGTSDSYIAYVANGALDIAQNEESQRRTPSSVGFTERERLLGDSALSLIKSNASNTCRNFKQLLGHLLNDENRQSESFWSTSTLMEAEDGFAGYRVNYRGEPRTFSATVIMSMFLTKLVDIVENWCKGTVVHAVIGVPSFFSDVHRVAMLDAAKIAGLNVLSLINEHAATALTYGVARIDELDSEKPLTVAFCMMGHAIFSVSIVRFVRGKLQVLFERSAKVGGRDMDECMMRRISDEFKKRHGCDPLSSKKASIKLEDQVTRTKKILSANMEATCSCESLMDDHDFSSQITRKAFDEMCAPLKRKVEAVLAAAKKGCGLRVSDIDEVEICGGASRVPWVKEAISKAFGGKELSLRLNADECVARGCALQAASLSPYYKVRGFKIEDVNPFPIGLTWDGASRPHLIFPPKSPNHVLKVLTFLRAGAFEMTAQYIDAKELVPGTSEIVGVYRIEVPNFKEPQKVKVKVVLSSHGTFEIQGAELLQDLRVGEGQNPQSNRMDLVVKQISSLGLSRETIDHCVKAEAVIREEMRHITDAHAKCNELEAYILSMRKVIVEGGKLYFYLSDVDRVAFQNALEVAEDWLWDHKEDEKEVFVAKLSELKAWGDPAEFRQKEEDGRKELLLALAMRMHKIAESNKDLLPDQKRKLDDVFQSTNEWLRERMEAQKSKAKHEDPVLTCADVHRQMELMEKEAHLVIHGIEEVEEENVLLMEPPSTTDAPPAEAVDVD